MSDVDINTFFLMNRIDPDFDHLFYSQRYPETKDFYQPYCSNNNIDDKHRLFFHYSVHGADHSYAKNIYGLFNQETIGIDINSLALDQNLEDIWPVNANLMKSYIEKTLAGKKIANQSKIAVVSLARDCSDRLQKSIDTVLKLELQELRFFIYENDSIDSTKNILYNNKIKHHNIDISLNNHNILKLTGLERQRTNNLAHYRNICLDWVKTNCQNFDYVIVLDLDAELGFSIDGIYNSIAWLDILNNAGGMGSYSLSLIISKEIKCSHYDSFAVRLNDWRPTHGIDNNNKWFSQWHPLVGSDPVLFYSCFGGLSIYKTEAFLSGNYDGSIGCEHVLFHKSLQDNGYYMYLNPSSRFFTICDIDKGYFIPSIYKDS